MPRTVHFRAMICLPSGGVLKGFLEEFLRRAEIRTYSGASPARRLRATDCESNLPSWLAQTTAVETDRVLRLQEGALDFELGWFGHN